MLSSMMGPERGRCLYNSLQSVVMPDGKSRDLRVDVTENGKPITKVEVRITDDADPSLLYILQVTEIDFNAIKSQQGLLVDFANFPVHLVKLLEQCLNSVKGFLLVLEENGYESYLKIVQPIDLKNLCYIALRVAKGSDTEIMRHMHTQIIQLKTSLSSKEEETSRLQMQVSQLQQDLLLRERQSQEQQRLWEDERCKIRSQASHEMDVLREQLAQERKRDLDATAKQREGLNNRVEELTKDVAKYKGKHWQICEKHEQAQQSIRELNGRLATFDERQSALNRELADLRRHNSELESNLRKKEMELDQTHSRAEALDKEVVRLRNRHSRQEEQLREADAEMVRLKSALSRMQETTEARSDLVLQLNGDLTKANLIIKERQKEMDKMRVEIQRLMNANKEHENNATSRALEMKLLHANAERDQTLIKSLQAAEKKLQKELATANETLAAKEEQHKKCGDVISYLHRSLNRMQLDPSPPSTAQGNSVLHSSAPAAPILYTLGSSLSRIGGGLHMSGPPSTGLPTYASMSSRPFSSTPLLASTASGGTGVTTRRSFPGALGHPVQSHNQISSETPARPLVDRVTLAQSQAKSEGQLKSTRQAHTQQKQSPNERQTNAQEKNQHKASGQLGSKIQKTESTVKGKAADKENKEWGKFKPSAYFQPNKIITDF